MFRENYYIFSCTWSICFRMYDQCATTNHPYTRELGWSGSHYPATLKAQVWFSGHAKTQMSGRSTSPSRSYARERTRNPHKLDLSWCRGNLGLGCFYVIPPVTKIGGLKNRRNRHRSSPGATEGSFWLNPCLASPEHALQGHGPSERTYGQKLPNLSRSWQRDRGGRLPDEQEYLGLAKTHTYLKHANVFMSAMNWGVNTTPTLPKKV